MSEDDLIQVFVIQKNSKKRQNSQKSSSQISYYGVFFYAMGVIPNQENVNRKKQEGPPRNKNG